MKIVINECFGGFGLSAAAMHAYWGRKGKLIFPHVVSRSYEVYFDEPLPVEFENIQRNVRVSNPPDALLRKYNAWYKEHSLSDKGIARNDPDLIAVIESLGATANGAYSELKIVDIPDDVDWEISEYDGSEHVAEKHRTWY